MKLLTFLVLILTVCGLTIPQTPQTNPQNQMVILNVRVKNSDGKAVGDVPQSSFVISENGVPQKISLFMNEEIPLSYGLLVDSSGSLRSQWRGVLRAAVKVVNSNKPQDEAFAVRFISSDKIETLQELTSDKGALINGINQNYIEGGQTAILDAIYLSAEYLAKVKSDARNLRRKVLIITTDGEDRYSYHKLQPVIELLISNDIQIFIIAFTKEVQSQNRDKAVKLVTKLASETGGEVYFPSSDRDIDRISDQIINHIRTQYVIGYMPSSESTKDFQKVEVSITDNPAQEKRVAVTRVGYSSRNKEQKSP